MVRSRARTSWSTSSPIAATVLGATTRSSSPLRRRIGSTTTSSHPPAAFASPSPWPPVTPPTIGSLAASRDTRLGVLARSDLALVGPTASGKSDLALAVACALGDVEIVSVDSMLVYRGMDIGTAKPSRSEQSMVPHHLIDVADPGEDWSVACFQRVARDAVADIEARGKRLSPVGGTGLYVQAVVDPLTFPPEDRAARRLPGGHAVSRRNRRCVRRVAARRPHRRGAHRARQRCGVSRRRWLEVIRFTGEPFSSFGPGMQSYGDTVFPVSITGIAIDRDVVRTRIEQRVDALLAAGLVDEVRGLRAHGDLSRTARQAIGYHEHRRTSTARSGSTKHATQTIRRTGRFARRQVRWFRRDPRITWLEAGENPCDLLPTLLALWSR